MVYRALRPEYVLVNVRYAGPRRQNFVAQAKIVSAGLFDLVPSGILAEDEFTRGEAQYLAPELKSFDPVASERCDVYSAGVMFYELLTGLAPVGTFQLPGKLRPDLPNHINDVTELALATAPDDRYRSVRDLANDLQRTFDDAELEDEKKPLIGPLGYVVAAMIGLVLLCSVGGIALMIGSKDHRAAAKLEDQQRRKAIEEETVLPSDAERKAIEAKHPERMIYIPPGPYLAGRLRGDLAAVPNAEPLYKRVEVEGFLIDAFEFPNEPGQVPRARVTHAQAEKLCAEQGKRLCTADEWEKACKGPPNHVYAYGDAFDPSICGEGVADLARFRSGTVYKECVSKWAVFDMSGGYMEWTSTPFKDDPMRRMVKGGELTNAERGSRCAYNVDQSVGYADSALSFRCCRDVDAPPPPTTPADTQD